jgi:hypothetical protein
VLLVEVGRTHLGVVVPDERLSRPGAVEQAADADLAGVEEIGAALDVDGATAGRAASRASTRTSRGKTSAGSGPRW